jgi:3'(2'), 5'-bisphosphate nucleotidase
MTDTRAENWLVGLLPRIVDLAKEAGNAILNVYAQADLAVQYKQDNSPLTQADLKSHRVIVDGLSRLSHDWPILSEESEEVPFDLRASWDRFWLVDPLDGTKEFLRRTGEFTVNIALVECGTPILGVVYAPVVDRMYFAARGAGAFKTHGGLISRIETTRPAKAILRTVISHSDRSQRASLGQFVQDVGQCEFIAMGSSLKFCLIAEGAADVYPRTGPTMEWDTAAAHCILVEAGGAITDLDGNSMRYNKPVLLNPGFVARGAV